MGRSRRILLAVHPQHRPDRRSGIGTPEHDVWMSLRRRHQVEVCALSGDLRTFDRDVVRFKPDLVFNLLEEFRGEGVFDFHVVTYAEAMGLPYTGCNPRGLIVSRDKFWTALLAGGSGIPVPHASAVTNSTRLPAFIKFAREHASLGITSTNLVKTPAQLRASTKRMRERYQGMIIAQEFVSGRDVTISVLGNTQPKAFPAWQLHLGSDQRFATERIKFSSSARRQAGIRAVHYGGPWEEPMKRAARRLFRILDLSGYARFDFRVNKYGFWLLDVNANPNLSKSEDFAQSARAAGFSYHELIDQILNLGVKYRPRV